MSDARYYNGGPDDHPRLRRVNQPKPEEPAASNYYGRPCGTCGRPCHRVYTLADVGVFCSPGCRSKATEPARKATA